MHQTFDEMTQEVMEKLNLPLEGHAFAVIRTGIRKAYAAGNKDGMPQATPICPDDGHQMQLVYACPECLSHVPAKP